MMWVIHIIRQLLTDFTFHRHLLAIILLFIFSSNSIIFSVSSFNIDWHYPIIIKTVPGKGVGGGSGSPNYFGASVTFLKPEQGNYAWIVVGAPKSNSTFTQHRDIPEPGAIWRCTLGKDPTDVCRPVLMDPTGNQHNGAIYEWKNGSLLGGANGMAMSSKSFVACASRLEKWQDGKSAKNITIGYMHGSCYVRPRSQLLQDDYLYPQPEQNLQRLNPLEEPKYENTRPLRNGQAGFAVHFAKSGNELAMTAPGLKRWMGSVIQYISRDGGVTFTKSYISEPLKCPESGVDCFNYFGYSLTSGYYYEKDVTLVNNAAPVYYAAGAPRANNLAGKVVVFRFPDDPEKSLGIQQEILGNQTGAYFGSSLLSLDLNGDGYDDLVVGSPRFSRDQKVQLRGRGGPFAAPLLEGRGFDRFGGYGDEGAVFIYLSTNRGRGLLSRQQQILRGGNRPWSHFGTAMVSLGDLNKDMYNDFAVSAPFEDTYGAVYIYHGNKDGIIMTPAQTILGKQVDSAIRGFGFSLAGSEDIDNNGFNDIAIGSFNSSQVVVLRAKPIITVHGAVKCSMEKLPLNILDFKIDSCVSVTGDYVPPNVELTIRLLADAHFQPHRVKISREGDFGGSFSSSYSYPQRISQSNGEVCTKFNVIVNEPLESSGAPVVFQQTISIAEDTDNTIKRRRMNIPSDNSDMYITGSKFSAFCKTCPLINTGKPSTFDLQLPLAILCGDDERCQADLHLEVFFKDVDGRFVVGSSPSVTMEIQLSNSNETAIQPAVLVSWWKLKLKRNPADCSPYAENDTMITYKCYFGKVLETGQTASVSLEYDMTTLVLSESGHIDMELFWNVTAHTVSEMARLESKTAVLPLSYSADPHIQGSGRFEVFNTVTLWKYMVFTHVFEVNLDGPSPIADLMVVFQLPVNLTTESKNPIVNVRAVKVESGGVGTPTLSCQTTRGHFSKNDEALGSEDIDDYDGPDDIDLGGVGGLLPWDRNVSRGSNTTLVENKRLQLHCYSPFVECIEVTCKQAVAVYNPGTTTVITFVIDIASEDIRRLMKIHKVSSIRVESQGKLILPSVVKGVQPTSHKPDETVSITMIDMEGHKPISKWIYILAVVIGSLILLCVGFCLYACGCFEEKRPEKAGDDVDGGGASNEEMQPLQEKPLGEDKVDNEVNDEAINDENEQDQENELLSPFSDVSEPPEFVPTEPTIPEESEDDNDDVKQED